MNIKWKFTFLYRFIVIVANPRSARKYEPPL